jgi:hypothetical protein
MQTDLWNGFKEQAIALGPVVMIYVTSFIKIGSGFRKLIGEIHRHTDSIVIA